MLHDDENYIMAGMETLLFMSDKPITLAKMRATINGEEENNTQAPLSLYKKLLEKLKSDFSRDMRGIEIAEIDGGLQLRTKSHMAAILRKLVKVIPLKLTSSNLETLAVIAYKQPITKDAIDSIRGVDSGYMLRALMEKRLVNIAGRSDLPGKPMIYGTSHEFLELFNLKDLTELPPLHEIESMVAASEVGACDEEEARLKEFGEIVDTQSTNLFEVGGLDEEIEALRAEIDSIPTSTEYIDLLKQKEKHVELETKLAIAAANLEALTGEEAREEAKKEVREEAMTTAPALDIEP